MTTVQLSSTFNTVHKNTSHINEQSVYTQGRPGTCDRIERFPDLSSFSGPHGRGMRAICTKKISARVAGRAKRRRNVPREMYDLAQGWELSVTGVAVKNSSLKTPLAKQRRGTGRTRRSFEPGIR